MPELTRAEVTLGARDRELHSALGRAERTLGSVGRRLGRIATRIGQAITAAFAAAGTAAVKFASDFEAEMTKLETLVGINRQQVQGWREDIQRIAIQTGQSLPELSRAMFAITSGGLRGSEALSTLLQSAKAAATGLGDIRSIGRTAAGALQGFGDQGLTASDAIDQMVATVRAGNLEASELAGSLGRVMGIASSLGVRFADLNAFVATFTRLGTSAEESVTSLRAILQGLTGVNKQATEAFERLNIPIAEVRRQIREEGLVAGLRTMIDAADGNIEVLTELVPNIRALAGFLGTAGTQAEEFARIQAQVRNSMGLTNEGFERTSQTLSFMLKRLRETVRVGLTQIGTEFLPELKQLASFLHDNMGRAFAAVIRGIADLVEVVQRTDAQIRNTWWGKLLGLEPTPASEAMARLTEARQEFRELNQILQNMAGSRDFAGLGEGRLADLGRRLEQILQGRTPAEVARQMHELAGEMQELSSQVSGGLAERLRQIADRIETRLGGAAESATTSVSNLRAELEKPLDLSESFGRGDVPLPPGLTPHEAETLGGPAPAGGEGFTPGALDRLSGDFGLTDDQMSAFGERAGESFTESMGKTMQRGARTAMEGLISGLLRGQRDLEDMLVSIGISIASTLLTQGLFSGLGIASPSREGIFAGHMLGEGIAVGVRDMLPRLRMESERMAAAAVPSMGSVQLDAGVAADLDRERMRPVTMLPVDDLRPHEESVIARSAQRIRQHVRDRDFRKLTGADRD